MIQTGNSNVCAICHYAQCGCQNAGNIRPRYADPIALGDNRVGIWDYDARLNQLEERLSLNEFNTQQCQNSGLNTDEELIRLTNLVAELRDQVIELSKELASIKANKVNVTNE